jgi:hypothetical protein
MTDTQLLLYTVAMCGAYLAAGLVSGVRVKVRNPWRRR